MPSAELDAISLEILKHAFVSASDEEALVTRRTAYSHNVRERTDFSAAICDPYGDMVAQAFRTPIHLGGISPCVREIIRTRSPIRPGDVFLSNDPYSGGQHPPDVQVTRPIFDGETLLGFACVLAHHQDFGGRKATGAQDVFEEGLRLHHVRLFDGGTQNEEVWRIIEANVRMPDDTLGDFRAQLAATATGARRVLEIAKRYGAEAMLRGMRQLMDASETLMRQSLLAIPKGIYRWSDFIDSDGAGSGPLPIVVTLDVPGDGSIKVDFTGTAAQGGGAINSCLVATRAAVLYSVRALGDPDIMQNEGCVRPIEVVAPEGTLVNPKFPAACNGRSNIAHRIADCVFGALSEALPERVETASYGTSPCYNVRATPSASRIWVYTDCNHGSGGARRDHDGNEGSTSKTSNPQNLPIEACESKAPVIFDSYEFVTDTGGAGRRRGGMGLKRSFRVLEDAIGELRVDRMYNAPYGLHGGRSGIPTEALIYRADGRVEELAPTTAFRLNAGDIFSLTTAGAGGFGHPVEREPELVLADVLDGKVSIEQASSVYRVAIADGTVDREATDAMRNTSAPGNCNC